MKDFNRYGPQNYTYFFNDRVFFGLIFLQACSPVGAASTVAASVGAIALEERTLEDSIADRKTKLDLLGELTRIGLGIFSRVNVNVVEGRVLLTGLVETAEQRLNVTKIVWGNQNVRDVINEILIEEKGNFLDFSRDVWIKKRLEAAYTIDQDILGLNYIIEVVGSRVYIFGITKSEEELQKAINLAKQTAYVRKVISHVTVKQDN